MRLIELLKKDHIFEDLKSSTKEGVLEELAQLIAKKLGVKESDITGILKGREKLGSTGIEDGIAIPHGKLKDLNHIVIAVGRSIKGIDFDASDQRLSHIFFVLLAPESETDLHLKVLARINRLLHTKSLRDTILEAKGREEIYRAILSEDERIQF